MKSTMHAIRRNPGLSLQVVIGGALLNPRYGQFETTIQGDGFKIDAHLDYIEGKETLEDIGVSAGRCTEAMARILAKLQPDILMVIADRYEALSIAHAALCGNIRIAHLEGGEISGSIDERIRHAITKLAHIHLVANGQAADRVHHLGEPRETINICGSPSLDLVVNLDRDNREDLIQFLKKNGEGKHVNLTDDYLVVSQHPVVTEYDRAFWQFLETAEAIRALQFPTIWILPNDDAGAGAAREVIKKLLENPDSPPIQSVGSIPLVPYTKLLCGSKCLVGNTSSGIRESAYLGVPVVNIGTRQQGRQRGLNVMDVNYDSKAIIAAVLDQVKHGPYDSDRLYGDGHAGEMIAEVLCGTLPELDKRMTF